MVDAAAFYKPLCPSTLANPFPVYKRLRSEAPIFWHEGLFAWVVSKHKDCERVLRNPEEFTRDRGKLGRPVNYDEVTIQSVDPPDQIALRQAVIQASRSAIVESAATEALDVLESLIEQFCRDRPFDFMRCVAAPTATHFASRLVGLTGISAEDYKPIFLSLTRAMDREVYSIHHAAGLKATQKLNGLVEVAISNAPQTSMIYELYRVPGVSEMKTNFVRNTLSAAIQCSVQHCV